MLSKTIYEIQVALWKAVGAYQAIEEAHKRVSHFSTENCGLREELQQTRRELTDVKGSNAKLYEENQKMDRGLRQARVLYDSQLQFYRDALKRKQKELYKLRFVLYKRRNKKIRIDPKD